MRTFLYLSLVLFSNLINAQSGTIDASFGTNGRVLLTPTEEEILNIAYDVAIQHNGKIITAGAAYTGIQVFGITRHHRNGMLDNSFGDDGVVTIHTLRRSSDTHSEAYGVAITPDGKIVVVGETADYVNRIPEFYSIVIRLNSDGTLDETFNGDGILNLKLSDPFVNERLWGVVVQSDGKIIANGTSRKNEFSSNQTMTIVRINVDGSMDDTFGEGGIVRIDPDHISEGTRVRLQTDGKIVATGSEFIDEEFDFLTVRLNNNGSLDNTFNGDGISIIDIGENDHGQDVAISMEGKIVVGGYGNEPGSSDLDIHIARLLSNGTPDITFDGDGKKTIDHSPEDIVQSIAIQNNGRIIICGYSLESEAEPGSITSLIKVTKLTNDGSLDVSFASDGSYEDNFGNTAFGMTCALQPDEKIVVGGWAYDGESSGRALTRINNAVIDCSSLPITGIFNEILVLPAGVRPNTVYKGYVPASNAPLQITVAGDPYMEYNYTWSVSNSNASFMVDPSDSSRIQVYAANAGDATVTVTVNDSRNCEATFTKTISINDVRCGNKLDKVLVCHVNKKDPNKSKTICISANAVPAMLNNGNYLGECGSNNSRYINGRTIVTEEKNGITAKVFNNPTTDQFILEINSSNVSDKISVRIIDQTGRLIEIMENIIAGNKLNIGSKYPTGIYFVEIRQKEKSVILKLVKL